MNTRIRLFLMIVTVAVLALLPACGAATPAAPTVDPNAIYTQAVLTVQSGLTETAAAAPTATATPEPTATVEPTATLAPPTATIASTLATSAPQPGSATQASTSAPATAPTVALGKAGDHCQFGSQSPADGFSILGGEQKQVYWSLVNTGTTTWTTGYKLSHVGGRQMSGTTSVPVEKDVKPGEKYDFYTIVVGPTTKGTFTSYWKLFNGGGAAFCEVYMKYVVP